MNETVQLPVDVNTIRSLIPHRYPFLLVDRIVDLDIEAKRIVGVKNVTVNEPFFQGHFPGQPIMPGVLIIEALAQAGGVLTQLSLGRDAQSKLFYMVKVDNARFSRQVVPGDVLELHMTVKRGGGKIWKFLGQAMVEGQLCAEAEFTAMMDLQD